MNWHHKKYCFIVSLLASSIVLATEGCGIAAVPVLGDDTAPEVVSLLEATPGVRVLLNGQPNQGGCAVVAQDARLKPTVIHRDLVKVLIEKKSRVVWVYVNSPTLAEVEIMALQLDHVFDLFGRAALQNIRITFAFAELHPTIRWSKIRLHGHGAIAEHLLRNC